MSQDSHSFVRSSDQHPRYPRCGSTRRNSRPRHTIKRDCKYVTQRTGWAGRRRMWESEHHSCGLPVVGRVENREDRGPSTVERRGGRGARGGGWGAGGGEGGLVRVRPRRRSRSPGREKRITEQADGEGAGGMGGTGETGGHHGVVVSAITLAPSRV